MYCQALGCFLFLLISYSLADFTEYGRERGLRQDGSQASRRAGSLVSRDKKSTEKLCYLSLPDVGGTGGDWFSDWETFFHSGYAKISKIVIRSKDRIDRICVTYGSESADCHGGEGGDEAVINLGSDEHIREVRGRALDRLDQLTFVTNKEMYGPYGGNGGKAFSFQTGGTALAFISGRSRDEVDNLQFYFNC